jgi:hypothetical protein
MSRETVTDYPALEPGVIDMGARHFMWPQPGDGWFILWWHDCPAVAHVSWGWIGQPRDGRQASGHVIRFSGEPDQPTVTVDGSLLCTDCGDHGFIRDSRWIPA